MDVWEVTEYTRMFFNLSDTEVSVLLYIFVSEDEVKERSPAPC